MHAAIQLVVFWALAFLSLGLALFLLNVFFAIIGNDLELQTLGKEVIIAGVASLVEALFFWAVVHFFAPGIGRAWVMTRGLIFPALIVAVIYKVTHLMDWSKYDIVALLAFQTVIGSIGACLAVGQFEMAFSILVFFGIALALTAWFMKGLTD
jgi:hypothetical protein